MEKLDISPEKIEEIYEKFDTLGIQIVGADLELDLDLDDTLPPVGDDLGGELNLGEVEEEELVDPVEFGRRVQPGRPGADVPEGNRPGEAPVRR